jgi:alpha-1,3-glucan synthase
LLALFVTTLHMPGIPLLLWGEEQAFYIMDNTAANYVFGRQSMSSSPAWQMHGCYKLGSTQYINWPLDKGLYGCQDETATYDHRDPSHPVRNIIKSMYALRDSVPVLRDGFNLQSLSKQTHQVQLPYSGGTPTEYGMWSVVRNKIDAIDELQSGNQSVWFVYQNNASAVDYTFDCTQNETALLAPFAQGTQVRNLLAPYDEVTLENGPGKKLFIDKSQEVNGCLGKMSFGPYGFKAYVPASAWAPPPPMLTHFVPGHDARLNSSSRVAIELHFSTEMDCDSVTAGISLKSTTADGTVPTIDKATVKCAKMEPSDVTPYNAFVPSTWGWSADLDGVSDGIHRLTVQNETTIDGVASTSVDHLLFRIGSQNNPMVFTNAANYTRGAYTKASGELVFTPNAAGADKWRYSTNWGSSWTNWTAYDGKPTTITELPWSGTKLQRWSGHHITTQYWSGLVGSSSHLQHADADWPDNKPARWFPHLFAQGLYNSFGYDAGLPNYAHQDDTGLSKFHFSSEWPATIQFNVWGMNPDGKPDKTYVFGDVNAENVLDRMVPQSLAAPVVNITDHPPAPHLAYEIQIDQGSQRYTLVPVGTRSVQVMLFALLWVLPVISASLAIWAYMGFFYKIKFNATGISKKGMGGIFGNFRKRQAGFEKIDEHDQRSGSHSEHFPLAVMKNRSVSDTGSMTPTLVAADKSKRRTVLIATIEYDIEDWNIKVKIGGLGVMAQLMGKALGEQDLIWVVPCVGGIEYPIDQVAEPMTVTILEKEYEVQVQYHKLRNITYGMLRRRM